MLLLRVGFSIIFRNNARMSIFLLIFFVLFLKFIIFVQLHKTSFKNKFGVFLINFKMRFDLSSKVLLCLYVELFQEVLPILPQNKFIF